MNDKGFLNIIRGLVRPYVAYLAFSGLVIMAGYLVYKFADRDMALLIIGGFLTLVAGLTDRYFASREASKRK